jgi:hypothetical protein
MKKGTKIWTVFIILSILAITPKSSFAGDKEWAVAGKILTGIVAANFIGQVIDDSPYIERKRIRYSNNRYPVRRKGHKNFKKSYYDCEVKKRAYDRQIFRKKPRGFTSHSYCSKDPIIVHIEGGRRIYQPGIRGATAYLQVYSKACNEWVTLEEYPSIW